jgi:hypothetical protein
MELRALRAELLSLKEHLLTDALPRGELNKRLSRRR